MYDNIDNIDKYIERQRDREHCGSFDGKDDKEYNEMVQDNKREYEPLGEELEDEIIKMRIRKGIRMKAFNDAITRIIIEVEERGYELMGVKPSSIHPDEYGKLFDILVKRDSGRYVVWSVTVSDGGVSTYWGNYFDGDNDRDIFFKALQRFNNK